MKTFLRILKWTAIVLVLVIGGFFAFVFSQQDKVYEAPLPDLHASTDSAVIARGKYLVWGPAHCAGCHSPESNLPRVMAGEEMPLEGGFVWNLPPGKLYSPNITPDETGIGKMSDQQIARALRYGVGHDGRALLDLMPFHNTSDEDLVAIISYLRTQPAVKKEVPKNEWNMLGKIIYALAIKPVGPEGEPLKTVTPDTTAVYGEYLANYVANCRGCHTNRDLKTGAYIGEYYSGGFAMPSAMVPGVICVTPNLTPDPETGKMTGWSQEKFIERIRSGRVIPGSEMPWEMFGTMTDNDLKAIYAYLQTLQPVKKDVGQTVITAQVN